MKSSHKWIPTTIFAVLLSAVTPIESTAAADDNATSGDSVAESEPERRLQENLPERGSIAILAAVSKRAPRTNSTRPTAQVAPQQEPKRKTHKWIVIAAAAVGAGLVTTFALRGKNEHTNGPLSVTIGPLSIEGAQ